MCWDAVITNCDGGPEVVAYYVLAVSLAMPPSWLNVGTTFGLCEPNWIPTPLPGEVHYAIVIAVDHAGNDSLLCREGTFGLPIPEDGSKQDKQTEDSKSNTPPGIRED